jgi:plasmid stabilization system protein ParE
VRQRNAYLKEVDPVFRSLAENPLMGRPCDEIREGLGKPEISWMKVRMVSQDFPQAARPDAGRNPFAPLQAATEPSYIDRARR